MADFTPHITAQRTNPEKTPPRGIDQLGSTLNEWGERYGGVPFTVNQAQGKLEAGDFSGALAYLVDLKHAPLLLSDLGRIWQYDKPELKQRMLVWWYDQGGKETWQSARTRLEAEQTLKAQN